MKITAISDVHIKKPNDEAAKLLGKFLDHSEVRSSDHVLLLGDIFDLMCGPHDAYLELYGDIFKKLDDLIRTGIKVHFFEGNHDVHLNKLFEKVWPMKELAPQQAPEVQKWDGKTYYFSHGDEHEPLNTSYQNYKSFILSPPLRFVANYLMPYSVLNFVGERASAKSRKRGSKYFDADKVRETFRAGVEETTKGKYDFVIGGHSHVQDIYQFSKSTYINNGYALRTNSFIVIDGHHPRFESLN